MVNMNAVAQNIKAVASNVVQGVNSAFTVADLLAVFPQFSATNIRSVEINAGGSGYHVDDVLTIVQSGASGGTAQVTSVATVGLVSGIVTGIALRDTGDKYSTFNGLGTTVSPSGGTGCKVNITAAVSLVPDDLLDLFISMATASIQEARWHSQWKYAMCLYVAHFCALYLQTQAGPNLTASQVVATAQGMFPKSSKSVGDVSVSYDTSAINNDIPGWAAWKSTVYGQQLATIARIVGRGGMYVW
jgi:hypothetical protein